MDHWNASVPVTYHFISLTVNAIYLSWELFSRQCHATTSTTSHSFVLHLIVASYFDSGSVHWTRRILTLCSPAGRWSSLLLFVSIFLWVVLRCFCWTFGIYFTSFLKVFAGCAWNFAIYCVSNYCSALLVFPNHPHAFVKRTEVCRAVLFRGLHDKSFYSWISHNITDVDNTTLTWKYCILRIFIRTLEKDVCCVRILCWIYASGLCADNIPSPCVSVFVLLCTAVSVRTVLLWLTNRCAASSYEGGKERIHATIWQEGDRRSETKKNRDEQKDGDHRLSIPVQSGFKVHALNQNHRFGVFVNSESLRKDCANF